MVKKIVSLGLVLGTALIVSGCGGGGGSGSPASPGGSNGTPSGSGTYVDAAVAGVSFECGAFHGTTGSDGSFTFEPNAGCTFSLNQMLLRSVPSGDLYDGVIIFEDQVPVAQLLQTLDGDGDASNGITIPEGVVSFLEENNITTLPVDPSEIENLFNQINDANISGYAGHFVTATEAAAHIESTRQSLDHTPPTITLNGSAEMTIAFGSTFGDPGYSVTDDYYAESEINVTVGGSVDTGTLGDYTLTYTAVDGAGNSASVTRTVHVTDQAAPVITVSNPDVTVEVGAPFSENDVLAGVSAADDVDGNVPVTADISQVNSAQIGDYTVTYSALDAAGHTGTATATVHVVDTTAPQITLNGNNPDSIEVAQGATYADAGATVTDNSGETIAAVVSGSVNAAAVGTYTLTYTATDSSGNQRSVTRTVNVVDTTPPVITLNGAADITVAYGSTFADPGAAATDNSGEAISVTASGSVNTNAIGTYTITYTAVDSHNNSAAETRTVHVADQASPVITVTNAAFTVEIGSTFVESDALAGVSATDDVDGSVSVAAAIGSVNTAMLGDYTVTYSATDAAGNTATATATVHVVDTTAPQITLNGNNPDSIEVAQEATYADVGATVTDNSGETISAVVSGSVNAAAVGTYTLTYTATDSSGNESNVTRTVEVVDTTSPVITLNGDNPMNVLLNTSYNEPGASVSDNSGENLSVAISGSVDSTTAGTYTITYEATDSSNNTATVTRTVNVTNGNAPVLTLEGDDPYIVEINTPYADPGASATDVEDGSVAVTNDASTAVHMDTLGEYTVIYTAEDSQNNIVHASRTVRVVDTTAPVITLNGNNPMVVNQDAAFTDPGATVSDNSGETLDVNVTGTVDTAVVGNYTLTYTAADSSGNQVSVTRTVTVVDVTPPVITTGGDVTVEVHTPYVDAGATAQDNVDGDISSNISVDTALVNTDVLGDYTVTYSVSDSAGNTATATITVHVIDTTPPVITVDGDNPLNLLVGDSYAEQGATVVDNYDTGLTATVLSNDVNTSAVGLYSVVYHAVDSSGNETNATRVVNVTAGQPPVITLIGNDPYDVLVGTSYSDPGATANDPEDGTVNVDVNTSEVDMSTLGTYMVYYSATDSQGNTSYAARTVNVVESVTLTANPDTVQSSEFSMPTTLHVLDNDYVPNGRTVTSVELKVWDWQTQTYQYVQASSNDRFGNWNVINNSDIEFTPSSTFPGGTVNMEYRITDDANNTAESWVQIEFPVLVKAVEDTNNTANDIVPFTVDVLANDTYSDATSVTISLESYDQNGQQVWTSQKSMPEGNWTVANGAVQFTPNDTFSGGTVWTQYRIEENGRQSDASITIDYPLFVRAQYDWTDMNDTTLPVTYDVMANDEVGAGVNAEVYLLDFSVQPPAEVKVLTDYNGEWSVEANQSITFVPAADFSGGMAHVEYVLTDGSHVSQTGFDIEYPSYLQAQFDDVQIPESTGLVPVNMDVLANDTLPGDYNSVTLLVQGYWDDQTQQQGYAARYEDNRGVWQVEANQTVTFTPSTTFGGGNIWWSYKISDGNGHESVGNMQISYPLYVQANYDETDAVDATQAVTYDVMQNDQAGSGITPAVQLVDFSTGQYVATLNNNGGTWSVETNNSITFTPDSSFGGGDAHVEYVLTDNNGHYSQTGFTIHYPVGPTPVCTVQTLSTVDDVYNAIANDLSFTVENGERRFKAEIDKDAYVIDPTLYSDAAAINGMNPMYMVYYEERTWTTYLNDTFIEAQMGSTEVGFFDSNSTWYYDDQGSGNDRGFKYLQSEGESGIYTIENDGSATLQIGGTDVFSVKAVRIISTSEINNILESAGISLTLDSSDTAQLNLTKELMNNLDWWGAIDDSTYNSLDEFIAAYSLDSTASRYDGNQIVNGQSWQKVILFAENASGNTSGTLVEIDRETNAVLTDSAGTWSIENITDDSGNTFEVVVVSPILCGYEEKIFRLDGTTVIQGQIDARAGEVGGEFAFSQSLKDKLEDYFISEAPLNIDPANPTNPEITDAMLDGKVFYTVKQSDDQSQTYYKRLTVDVNAHQITKEDYTTDSNGNLISSSTQDLSYEIDKGRIRIQGPGDVKIGLNSDPAGGDWDVTIYTWDGITTELWMLNEPADFPAANP